MKSHCFLKGILVVLLFWVQASVFAQSDALPANPYEQHVIPDSDSLPAQAAFNLLSFTGTSGSGPVTLTWKTDSRSHFTGFTLERRGDETVFSAIGDVAVANGNKTNSFTYADNKPVAGRNFYRLKMTDSSGRSSYSTVISVTHILVNTLQVHYDATSGTIALAGMEASIFYQLKVYNCNGQMVFQKTVTTATATVPISQLPHGLYVVHATDGTAAPVSQKIIW